MLEQNYRVVITGTDKGSERFFSPLKTEKNKSKKKQKEKWYNLLLKINKIRDGK